MVVTTDSSTHKSCKTAAQHLISLCVNSTEHTHNTTQHNCVITIHFRRKQNARQWHNKYYIYMLFAWNFRDRWMIFQFSRAHDRYFCMNNEKFDIEQYAAPHTSFIHTRISIKIVNRLWHVHGWHSPNHQGHNRRNNMRHPHLICSWYELGSMWKRVGWWRLNFSAPRSIPNPIMFIILVTIINRQLILFVVVVVDWW